MRTWEVRLLPLSVLLIVVTTAIPVEMRPLSVRSVSWDLEWDDALANVVLYMLIGLTAPRANLWRLALGAGLLSALTEGMQLFAAGRYPGVPDVVANTAGAVLGCLAARRWWPPIRWGPERLALDWRIGCAAGGAAIVLLGVLSIPPARTDFSNWNPDFDLGVGDEFRTDRHWDGTLSEVVILSQFLDGTTVRSLSRGPSLIASLPANVEPLFHLEPPASLDEIRGRSLLDEREKDRLFRELTGSGRLSVLARLSTNDVLQEGPDRIVTFSHDGELRNFTLAQDPHRLVFRLRTPSTGPNGTRPQAVTRPVLGAGREILVAVTYDGTILRIYLDGVLQSRRNLKAASKPLAHLSDGGLPISATFCGLLVAVAGIGLAGRRFPPRILAVLGGLAGGALLVLVGGTAALPAISVWVPGIGLVVGIVVAAALVPSPPSATA